jgi:hypothetical protein
MAEPNERPADTRRPTRPAPGASGRFGEPNEDVGDDALATNASVEGATPGTVGEAPESAVRPTSTGAGSDSAAWGGEAAGGSVADKRAPDAKRRAEQRGSAEAIGERLRDAD